MCDGRRDSSALQRDFPSVDFVDFTAEADDWFYSRKENDAGFAVVRARAVRFMDWLWTNPERRIAVVSHTVLFEHLFHVLGRPTSSRLKNAELYPTTMCR